MKQMGMDPATWILELLRSVDAIHDRFLNLGRHIHKRGLKVKRELHKMHAADCSAAVAKHVSLKAVMKQMGMDPKQMEGMFKQMGIDPSSMMSMMGLQAAKGVPAKDCFESPQKFDMRGSSIACYT